MKNKETIKPEDFPIEMSKKNINILAHMALEEVISEDWRKITFELLSDDENILVNNRISEILKEQEEQRWNSLSKEEQEEEQRKIKESGTDKSNEFRGNILQQELDSINLRRISEEKKRKNNS